MDLFCYGTLIFDEIWEQVTGRECPRQEAQLTGYRRYHVKDQVYPCIRPVSGRRAIVTGVVRFGLAPGDWARLDAFEGDCYQRVSARCLLASGERRRVQLYVLKPEFENLASSVEWDPKWFEENVLRRMRQSD